MCIRDSSTTLHLDADQFRPGGAKLLHGSCMSDDVAPGRDGATVRGGCLLYTSPSPETVLDLVCRLLLEKKQDDTLNRYTTRDASGTQDKRTTKH